MRVNRTIFLFASTLLVGCLYASRGIAETEFDQCGNESAVAFEDWRNWYKTTPEPYFSSQHANDWVTIYFDELARSSDFSTTGEFAVCAKIGKVHFKSKRGLVTRYLMLMTKMPAGFDPGHGDWWYGYYDISVGAGPIEQGVVDGCIACHEQAASLDYVFARDTIANSVK